MTEVDERRRAALVWYRKGFTAMRDKAETEEKRRIGGKD